MAPQPRSTREIRTRRRLIAALAIAALLAAILPTVLGSLTGSGQLNDVVQLTTSTGTIAGSAMVSSAGAPAAASSAFTMTNSNSNIDTYVRFGYSTTPYYGSSSSQTSISLRGTTYQISDLLWFKEAATVAGTTTTSQYFSPLLLQNAATNTRAAFTSAGNACTGWTGSAAVGFTKTAAGTFTFNYHDAASPVDDTPSTSASMAYCVDTTNAQMYVGTSASFASATLIKMYTTDATVVTPATYQFEFLPGSYTRGNLYCFVSVTGSGTSATPDLAQCGKLAYSASGASTVTLTPMFDPPAAFPSNNQGGAASVLTYALSGTQWNPYAHATTNSA